jgi:hypothetical protein
MATRFLRIATAVVGIAEVRTSAAVPLADEVGEARQWAAAQFEGKSPDAGRLAATADPAFLFLP